MSSFSVGVVIGTFLCLVVLCAVAWLWYDEHKHWNHGCCRTCGSNWHRSSDSCWDWEGHYTWFECVQGHRIGLAWLHRNAEPLPSPAPAVLRASLQQTLSCWRSPANGVRLELLHRTRTVIDAVADSDLAGLCLQKEDDDVVHVYRTRDDNVFESIRLHVSGNATYHCEGPGDFRTIKTLASATGMELAGLFWSDTRTSPAEVDTACSIEGGVS